MKIKSRKCAIWYSGQEISIQIQESEILELNFVKSILADCCDSVSFQVEILELIEINQGVRWDFWKDVEVKGQLVEFALKDKRM